MKEEAKKFLDSRKKLNGESVIDKLLRLVLGRSGEGEKI